MLASFYMMGINDIARPINHSAVGDKKTVFHVELMMITT